MGTFSYEITTSDFFDYNDDSALYFSSNKNSLFHYTFNMFLDYLVILLFTLIINYYNVNFEHETRYVFNKPRVYVYVSDNLSYWL